NDIERSLIKQALETIPNVQIAGERTDLRAGMALAHQVRPTILVLELAGAGEDTLSQATQYRLDNPDVAIFLSSEQLTPDLLMRAMRAGAQEVLRRPLDCPALTEAVERVAELPARHEGGRGALSGARRARHTARPPRAVALSSGEREGVDPRPLPRHEPGAEPQAA